MYYLVVMTTNYISVSGDVLHEETRVCSSVGSFATEAGRILTLPNTNSCGLSLIMYSVVYSKLLNIRLLYAWRDG